MTRAQAVLGILIVFCLAFSIWGYGTFYRDDAYLKEQERIEARLYDPEKIWTRTAELTPSKNATQHFKKHRAEFGFETEEEYIRAAVAFINSKSPDMMRNRQRDGDYAYYNPKTAEYAVLTKRGRIRTYFKLDPKIHGYPTNLDYFKAQARKVANDNWKGYQSPPPYNN